MKSPELIALLATAAVVAAGLALRPVIAEEPKPAVCPVSGAPATVAAAPTHINGQALLYCCNNCPKAAAADPEKVAAKMTLKCPVMTAMTVKPAKNLRLAVNNGFVYFCCGGCPTAFLKSPEKFVKELKDPVSGETFKLTSATPHLTHKGGHFYFANAQSKTTFEQSPDKYAQIVGT